MKSARLFLACVPFVLLIANGVSAQDRSTVNAQANTVYVSADGKFESAPDTAQIQFNVSVQDETSQAAFQRASKNVEQVRQVLRANGIDPKAANIGFLSVQPAYEYRPKQHVVGYRVTTDVTLKLKDFAKVGPITQQLADANISTMQRIRRSRMHIAGPTTPPKRSLAPVAELLENSLTRRLTRLKIRG